MDDQERVNALQQVAYEEACDMDDASQETKEQHLEWLVNIVTSAYWQTINDRMCDTDIHSAA